MLFHTQSILVSLGLFLSNMPLQSAVTEYNDTELSIISEAKVLAGDEDSFDSFGFTVCVDGDTALVGVYDDDLLDASGNDYLQDAGSVYVFVRNNGVWSEQAKLVASDRACNDFFGCSVSISGDTALVGAYGDDIVIGDSGEPISDAGSSYVFVRSNGVWSEQAKLVASDVSNGEDFFGYSVSISGNTALVGAYRDDIVCGDSGPTTYDAGSSYVFVRSNGVWSEQAKLVASDGEYKDFFGYSVSISGNTVLVGAYRDDIIIGDSGDLISDAGSSYVFVRNNGVWSEQAKLVASDVSDGEHEDFFGYSVSISGNTALVGAYRDEIVISDTGPTISNMGSSHVFVRSNGVWSEQTKLVASDGNYEGYFGRSVSISGDTALVGAYNPLNYMPGSEGSAYFYKFGFVSANESPVSVADNH